MQQQPFCINYIRYCTSNLQCIGSKAFHGNIEAPDRVCYTCYKYHNIILQKSKSVSSDSDLKQLITTYAGEIPRIDEIATIEDVITATKTVVLVGRVLLREQAMLLPTIHNHFNRYARDLLTRKHFESKLDNLVSARWLLSTLSVKLQHHIAYSCKVLKHGTVV